mmetsp:Transcript_53876/g.128302  ORF Transcript_53876/g.128302 Transcript_53876/m.128302 type:complete len:227 (-) Transcript_53876:74-754(-)
MCSTSVRRLGSGFQLWSSVWTQSLAIMCSTCMARPLQTRCEQSQTKEKRPRQVARLQLVQRWNTSVVPSRAGLQAKCVATTRQLKCTTLMCSPSHQPHEFGLSMQPLEDQRPTLQPTTAKKQQMLANLFWASPLLCGKLEHSAWEGPLQRGEVWMMAVRESRPAGGKSDMATSKPLLPQPSWFLTTPRQCQLPTRACMLAALKTFPKAHLRYSVHHQLCPGHHLQA